MSLPGIGNPLRGGQLDNSVWRTQWSFPTPTTVAISTDGTTDRDERVPTPIAYVGVGVYTLRFPKCAKAVPMGSPNVDSTTVGLMTRVTGIDAAGGTATVRFFSATGTPADPAALAVASVVLLLSAP